MESKKQSSIEYMVEQYANENYSIEVYQQAKELHKQEIIDAYEMGFADGWNYVKYDKPKYSDAEQYYRDTYKD